MGYLKAKVLSLVMLLTLLMFVISTLPIALAQDDVGNTKIGQTNGDTLKLYVYGRVLSRLLPLISMSKEINDTLKYYAQYIINLSIDDLKALKPPEIAKLLRMAQYIVSKLRYEVKYYVNTSKVREVLLKNVVKAVGKLASKYGVSDVEDVIKEVNTSIRRGELTKALKLIKSLEKRISEVRLKKASQAIEDSFIKHLRRVSEVSRKEALSVKGLERALVNINKTVEVLGKVKELLAKTNASEHALRAIERAITNIIEVREVLETVSLYVSVVSPKAGKVLRNVTISKIMSDIEETEREVLRLIEEVKDLLNTTEALANETWVKGLRSKLKSMLDQLTSLMDDLGIAKDYLIKGNVTLALKILVKVRIEIKHIVRGLMAIEEFLKRKEELGSKLAKKLREELNREIERIKEIIERVKELKFVAIKLNATKVLNLLTSLGNLVGNSTSLIKVIEDSIGLGNISLARFKLMELRNVIAKIEHKVRIAQDILSKIEKIHKKSTEIRKVVKELINEVRSIERDIKHLIKEVSPELKGNLTQILSNTSLIRNLILRVEEMINESRVEDAEELIKHVKDLINELKEEVLKIKKYVRESLGLPKAVKEQIKELNETLRDLSIKLRKLRIKALKANLSDILSKLDELNDKMNESKKLLSLIHDMIVKGNISKVENLINELKQLMNTLVSNISALESNVSEKCHKLEMKLRSKFMELERILNMTRKRIEELKNVSISKEFTMNLTLLTLNLSIIEKIIMNISILINEGNYSDAEKLISIAETLLESLETHLKDIEMKVEDMRKELEESLSSLEDRFKELKKKFEDMKKKGIGKALLEQISKLIERIENLISEVKDKLSANNISAANNLIDKISNLIEKLKELIESISE